MYTNSRGQLVFVLSAAFCFVAGVLASGGVHAATQIVSSDARGGVIGGLELPDGRANYYPPNYNIVIKDAKDVVKIELLRSDSQGQSYPFPLNPIVMASNPDQTKYIISGPRLNGEYYQIRVTLASGATLGVAGVVPMDIAAPSPPPNNLNPIDLPHDPSDEGPIDPKIQAPTEIVAGSVWTPQITTDGTVASVDILFDNGRRLPLQGSQAGSLWQAPAVNAKFNDEAILKYTLRIVRGQGAAAQDFPGGTLAVKVTQAALRIQSAPTAVQGTAYDLKVTADKPASRVLVRWADRSSDELMPFSPGSQLASVDRVFPEVGPVGYEIKAYDAASRVVGTLTGSVQVAPQAPSLTVGNLPSTRSVGDVGVFAVNASLSVHSVAVQLGSMPPVDLVLGSVGQSRYFTGQLRMPEVGPAVPYVILGKDAAGQVVARSAGTLTVLPPPPVRMARGNPVPAAGIEQGGYANWDFGTAPNAKAAWLEFAPPIGRLDLTGIYLKRVFNEPPGSYPYRLMVETFSGQTMAVEGGAGTVLITPKVTVPTITGATLAGQPLSAGAVITQSLSQPMVAAATANGAKGLVLRMSLPTIGNVERIISKAGDRWALTFPPVGGVGDQFRGMIPPGTVVPAQLYWGTGGTNTEVNLGGTISFSIKFVP